MCQWKGRAAPPQGISEHQSEIHLLQHLLKEILSAGNIQSLEKPAFKLRDLCLFLKLGRVNISLCKCHYSAFIRLTVRGKSQLMACAKGRRKEGKGGRDSHAGIVHRGRDRAVRHSCTPRHRWTRKEKKKNQGYSHIGS